MSMAWVAVGSAVIGAGASVYSANKSSDAINSASGKAKNVQLAMYNQSRADLAPYRASGYAALDQINQLYGLSTPGNSAWMAQYGTPITVAGRGASSGKTVNPTDPMGTAVGQKFGLPGFSKSQSKKYGATIDPITGTVTIAGDPYRSEYMTNYLRTGQGSPGKKLTWVTRAIDNLRASGWTYDPNRTAQSADDQAAQSGERDLSQFYTSPQYEFNRSEGLRGLENSAAARGGAFSGNAIRGSEMFASNLASGEFNSYVDRLFAIAGLGQNSTNTGVVAGQNTANTISNIYQNMGNARASSYLAAGGGVNNAIQGGIQNWAFNNYLNRIGGSGGYGYQPGDELFGLKRGG